MDNQNSPHTWAKRVREYDVVSNRRMSKEEAWKKLRERLDAKPERKKMSWYWVAAASVVSIIILTLLFTRPGNVRLVPPFTKAPENVKPQNLLPAVTDSRQPAINGTAKSEARRNKNPEKNDSTGLQLVQQKNESVFPLPVDSVFVAEKNPYNDPSEMAQQSPDMPVFHINELKEPLPPNSTIQSLSVKKMIRLFNTDFTGGQVPGKQENMHKNPNSIPNNLN